MAYTTEQLVRDVYNRLGHDAVMFQANDVLDAIMMAKQALEPLGEQTAYTIISSGATQYDLPTDTYFVEDVLVSDGSRQAARPWPRSQWAVDYGNYILYLPQPPTAGNIITVIYRRRYDWVTPTWSHSFPDGMNSEHLGNHGSGNPWEIWISIHQAVNITTTTTVRKICFHFRITANAEQFRCVSLGITRGDKDTFDYYVHRESLSPAAFIGDLSTPAVYVLPQPITFTPGHYALSLRPALASPPDDNYLLQVKFLKKDFTGSPPEPYYQGAWVETYETKPQQTFYFPWAWCTEEDDVEIDPEFVRLQSLAHLYLMASALPAPDGPRCLSLGQMYQAQADGRKALLLQWKQAVTEKPK